MLWTQTKGCIYWGAGGLMAKDSKSDWVGLREAADILGVHPATVRNWADRGDLPSRRTPGGHRRFRRTDLEEWSQTRHTPPPAEVRMLIQSALGRMRMHISEGEMTRLEWYNHMDENARHQMRQKGLQILDVLQHYLADRPDSEEQVERVRRLGQEYAEFLIAQGLTLSQAMQGFLVFSDFLHEAALTIVEVVTIRSPLEWLSLLRQVRLFNNQLVMCLTQVYEEKNR